MSRWQRARFTTVVILLLLGAPLAAKAQPPAPGVHTVGVITPNRSAPLLGIDVSTFPVKTSSDLPPAFRQMLAWRADAAVWLSGQSLAFQLATIELTIRHRLPVMVTQRDYVEAGGLISYFADHGEL